MQPQDLRAQSDGSPRVILVIGHEAHLADIIRIKTVAFGKSAEEIAHIIELINAIIPTDFKRHSRYIHPREPRRAKPSLVIRQEGIGAPRQINLIIGAVYRSAGAPDLRTAYLKVDIGEDIVKQARTDVGGAARLILHRSGKSARAGRKIASSGSAHDPGCVI